MEFTISFDTADLARANRWTSELAAELERVDPSVQTERGKTDPQTMDLGAVIGVVVSSGAALAVARGIGQWLERRQGASITISRDGAVVAKGITSKDAVRLMELAKGSE